MNLCGAVESWHTFLLYELVKETWFSSSCIADNKEFKQEICKEKKNIKTLPLHNLISLFMPELRKAAFHNKVL